MAEVKTEDIKVGEVYRVRITTIGKTHIFPLVRVVAVQTDLMHTHIVTGIRVEWLEGDRPNKVFAPTRFHTV